MDDNTKKLDRIDRKILYTLDLDSGLPFRELGNRVHVSKETAAYRVKRLMKNGYIKNFLTTIYISNLNRFCYKLFYKFHKTTPQIDDQINEFIQKYGRVNYLASLEGRYDLALLLLAKDFSDLYVFLIPFREQFGEYILEQEILTLVATHRFNFRFFYDKGELVHTQYPEKLAETKLDSLDYLILKTLASNSRTPLVELARRGNTDINVIKYRIKKMKKANILGNRVLDIRFDRFGMQQVQVDFSMVDHAAVKRLIGYVAHLPQSTYATVTLGKYDLAVEWAVGDTRELRNILNKIKEQFAESIVNYDVFIMEEHGINWFPYEPEKHSR